ncbi:MAG: hypothetical protein ACT4QG_09270 [Sporichthyaceae bacterium]
MALVDALVTASGGLGSPHEFGLAVRYLRELTVAENLRRLSAAVT